MRCGMRRSGKSGSSWFVGLGEGLDFGRGLPRARPSPSAHCVRSSLSLWERVFVAPFNVMAGLDPAIHVLMTSFVAKTWIRGSSPRMTMRARPSPSAHCVRSSLSLWERVLFCFADGFGEVLPACFVAGGKVGGAESHGAVVGIGIEAAQDAACFAQYE